MLRKQSAKQSAYCSITSLSVRKATINSRRRYCFGAARGKGQIHLLCVFSPFHRWHPNNCPNGIQTFYICSFGFLVIWRSDIGSYNFSRPARLYVPYMNCTLHFSIQRIGPFALSDGNQIHQPEDFHSRFFAVPHSYIHEKCCHTKFHK